jgi:hypothetical protein
MPGLQQPGGFPDDLRLVFRSLHREHGFAVDDRGRCVRQPGVFRQAQHAALFRPVENPLHQRRSVLVPFDRRVACGVTFQGQPGGFTEAGRKFDHGIAGLDVQRLDHAAGHSPPAGTEDSFPQACQQPMARHLLDL